MYNIYIKEKKEKEDCEKQLKEIKEREIEIKRKSLFSLNLENCKKLAEKYENRIKNFLFEMAKNPVFIKDNMESNLSSRENTIDDDKL